MDRDEGYVDVLGTREVIRVPTALAARLEDEEILVREGDELAVSAVLHSDSVLAVLMALGARRE